VHYCAVMQERRQAARLRVAVPVAITTSYAPERVGMTRDVSATGILFHSVTKFDVGEDMRLVFTVNNANAVATGRVVRAQVDPNVDTSFRHITAVKFDYALTGEPRPIRRR
jgi:hypothetical protein